MIDGIVEFVPYRETRDKSCFVVRKPYCQLLVDFLNERHVHVHGPQLYISNSIDEEKDEYALDLLEPYDENRMHELAREFDRRTPRFK